MFFDKMFKKANISVILFMIPQGIDTIWKQLPVEGLA